jgi:ankyrin repeat protein
MESKGGKILSQNSNGWTTLHIAAFVGNAVVLRMLVSSHVDLEVCDMEGSIAFCFCFKLYFDFDFKLLFFFFLIRIFYYFLF